MSVLDHINLDEARYDIQDTKAQAMLASAEESTTACAAHAAGTYFILNGALYWATANIAQGGTIYTSGANQNCQTVPGGLGGEISGAKSAMTDYEADLSNATRINAIVGSTGKCSAGGSRYTRQIPAQGLTHIIIKANATNESIYAFLASTMEGLANGADIPFAPGETGKYTLESGKKIMVTIPAGCNYITFQDTYGNNNHMPAYVTVVKETSPVIINNRYKKIGAVGHSVTYGMRLSDRRYAWPCVTANILGVPTVQNIAIGGTCIAKQEDSYEDIYFSVADFEAAQKDETKLYLVKDEPTDAHPFMLYEYANGTWQKKYEGGHNAERGARVPNVDLVRSLDADVDIILIGAGYNDYQYGWTPFGAVNDTPTKYTFCGAVHLMLQYIKTTYPGVPVFFTDTPINALTPYTEANSIGKTYADYLNAMKEIARYYKVPFVDIDGISNIPLYAQDATWYENDEKHHPSKKCHARIGQVMAAQIKSILG